MCRYLLKHTVLSDGREKALCRTPLGRQNAKMPKRISTQTRAGPYERDKTGKRERKENEKEKNKEEKIQPHSHTTASMTQGRTEKHQAPCVVWIDMNTEAVQDKKVGLCFSLISSFLACLPSWCVRCLFVHCCVPSFFTVLPLLPGFEIWPEMTSSVSLRLRIACVFCVSEGW